MASVSSSSLASWPTQEEAAQQLGTSVRTIRRLMTERKVTSRLQPVAGRKPVVLIDPEDVQRILRERMRPVLLAARDAERVVNPDTSPHAPDVSALLPSLRVDERLVSLLAAGNEAREAKPWLTLDESVSFSGLTRAWLLKQAESGSGSLAVRDMGKHARGGRWRFNRTDLQRA